MSHRNSSSFEFLTLSDWNSEFIELSRSSILWSV